MLFILAAVVGALQIDITGREALRKVKGSFHVAFLKAKRALTRAFGPIVLPIYKVLEAAVFSTWHFVELVIHLILDGLRKWHIALIQGVKSAGSVIQLLKKREFGRPAVKKERVSQTPLPEPTPLPTPTESQSKSGPQSTKASTATSTPAVSQSGTVQQKDGLNQPSEGKVPGGHPLENASQDDRNLNEPNKDNSNLDESAL
jgi:hypothetical protein